MRNEPLPVVVLVLLLVAAALQFSHYYGVLPETLATHFGPNLQADGWSGKNSFFITYAAVELGTAVVMLLPVLLLGRIPASWVNLPNREYWLAPERLSETMRMLATEVLWLSNATIAFLIALAEIIFRANLTEGTPRLGSVFFVVLFGFLAAVTILSFRLYRRFARIPYS